MMPSSDTTPAPWVKKFANELIRGNFRKSESLAIDAIFAALQRPAGQFVNIRSWETRLLQSHPLSSGWASSPPYLPPGKFSSLEELQAWILEISQPISIGEFTPKDFPLLLLHTGALGYWYWKVFSVKFRPLVVVVDYDPSWHPHQSVSAKPTINNQPTSGPSLRALERLGQRLGYSLVGAGRCEKRHRAFFVCHELLAHDEQLLPHENLTTLPWLFWMPRKIPRDLEIVECNYLQPRYLVHLNNLLGSRPVILECGSRDALDACALAAFYNTRVIAFECNPQALTLCRQNTRFERRVTLIEKAVWIEDGTIDFFPVEGSETVSMYPEFSLPGGNIGASSCFQATNDNPLYPEKYTQSRITVPATRLDTFCQANGVENIDLLCMDLQGAELKALQSLGSHLEKVRMIITEVTTKAAYDGADTYDLLSAFLTSKGFRLVEENLSVAWGLGDAMFIRS